MNCARFAGHKVRLLLHVAVCIAVLCPAALTAQRGRPAPGQTIRESQPDGRTIRIIEPTKWNGRIVIDGAGFNNPIASWSDSLWAVMRAQGYAILAAPFNVTMDLRKVTEDVAWLGREAVRRYGATANVYLVAHSATAYAALAASEAQGGFRGTLALCPLTATLDDPGFIVDALVGFDFYFPGIVAQRGGTLANVRVPTVPEILAPLRRSPDRAQKLSRALQVRVEDLPPTIAYYAAVLSDVQRLAGGNPVDLRHRPFSALASDVEFERSVTRFAADEPAARRMDDLAAKLTGRLATKTLVVHTAYDPLLPLSTVRAYRDKVRTAGSESQFSLHEVSGAGHCVISTGERLAAIDALVRWTEKGATRPTAALQPATVTYPAFEAGSATEFEGSWLRLSAVINGRPRAPDAKVVNTWRRGVTSQVVNDVPNDWHERVVTRPAAIPKEADFFDILGDVTKGIYEVRGDTLRLTWYLGERGYLERPKGFSTSGQQINTFRRILPP